MKLDGINVVDLSLFLPGPQMTAMMADHGASVIKVEPPGGDPSRHMGPFEQGQSLWFRTLNRGKHSLALDLKSEADRQRLYDLVSDADVFIEGFRPGVAKRLQIDYDTLAAINPKLVYCAISAFGQHGKLSTHPAHDMAVQAYAGFMSVNDRDGDCPVVPSVPSADMGASLTALSAVLMALIGRSRTGEGDFIDIAMYDSVLPWCSHYVGPSLSLQEPIQSARQRSLGGAAFYNVYACRDGRYVVLGGREEKFVRTLLAALDREDLIDICLSEAGPAQVPAIAFLTETFLTKTRDEWEAWFEGKDVCFAPVLNFVEAFSHPHIAAREMLVTGPRGEHLMGTPIKFAKEPGSVSTVAPELDAGVED